MAEIGSDIHKALDLLNRGELVAIPTETVYGLAGNALNIDAVAKIFSVKNRPQFDPLIVHVPDVTHAREYVEGIPDPARALTDKFWPGPLTILFRKKPIVPDLVTAGLETVGIRCPNHRLTRQLLDICSFPLAAPSANPFGYVSPTTPAHVNEQLGDKIRYILDGGPCHIGLESTIVGFEDSVVVVYRLGGLSVEQIEKEIGPVDVRTHSVSNPKAPGQLKSHYAPGKRVILGKLEELIKKFNPEESGILSFDKDYQTPFQFILSPTGSIEEAAKNLFTALRTLEKMPVKIILAELVPDIGLGRAINDRLRRSSAS
ncbi:MAG TPA: L-threonylcarbamoyladenylate synthase [Cyclobacteriaceae bacterium]|nr:L-threonylcarbamoyladenylate synthase [Cyclobacteriaceae bacterium]